MVTRHALVMATVASLATIGVPDVSHADPSLRDRSYHLGLLRIPEAHEHATGQGIVVAVVDSGVDAGHPDLAGQILSGIDLTATGDATVDKDGHGTAMAGIIAGRGGGENRILGIAPGAKIFPVRIGEGGSGQNSTIANAIKVSVDHGATIINISMAAVGSAPKGQLEAVQYAIAHNVVVVAGVGNTSVGMSTVGYPASIPGVIAVTGLDVQGEFWSESVRGHESVLSAPGQNIPSTDSRAVSTTGYELGSGTSASAAIVSGVVALIRSKYRTLDAANVINRLIRTADDLGPPGRDPQYGFGRVNPLKALTDSVPPVTTNPLGAPQTSSPAATPTTPHSTSALGPWTNPDAGIPPWLLATLGALALLLVSGTIFLVARAIRRPSENPHHPLPPPTGLP